MCIRKILYSVRKRASESLSVGRVDAGHGILPEDRWSKALYSVPVRERSIRALEPCRSAADIAPEIIRRNSQRDKQKGQESSTAMDKECEMDDSAFPKADELWRSLAQIGPLEVARHEVNCRRQ